MAGAHQLTYDAPEVGAAVVSRKAQVVAVTGRVRNAYYPVMMPNGWLAWVRERDIAPRTARNTGFIMRTREGGMRTSHRYGPL